MRFKKSVTQYLVGGLSLGLLTLICFRLGIDLSSTAILYLLLLTVLSLSCTVLGAAMLSIAAAACLNFFFTPPVFTFRIERPQDLLVAIAFLVTAGTVTRLVVSVRSRTEAALQAEATLRRTAAYFTEAQRLSRTGSFGWRTSDGTLSWSEETFRIFQYDPGEKSTVDLALRRCHPEDLARVKQTLERAAHEGSDLDYQHRILMPDGAVKHIHVVGHAEKIKSGFEFVGAVTDITAAETARNALRISEQQWHDVFENNPTMYFMVDAAGVVMAVNPFGAQQLGYNVAELVGQPVDSVFVEPDRAAANEKLAACLAKLGQPLTWQLRKTRKDGSVLWVRETARAVLRAESSVVLIACEDITALKQAEERLQQAQANLARVNRVMLVGEMTASIAHEVNQPLTGVVAHSGTCLRWLDTHPPDIQEARQALQLVIRDSHRAADVIDRIRELVCRVPPHTVPLHVEEAIREVLALVQGELERHTVRLGANFTPDLPVVSADRVQFQQVVLNLIVNAIEAMHQVHDRPRELIVCGRADAKEIFIEVRDSGPGLDPGSLSRLFGSFYTTKPTGMGMGLSISRSIVETHGGRIWAVPNKPCGAVFSFTLPLDDISLPERPDTDALETSPRTHPI
jgi:PAS domain S-box-containing protein